MARKSRTKTRGRRIRAKLNRINKLLEASGKVPVSTLTQALKEKSYLKSGVVAKATDIKIEKKVEEKKKIEAKKERREKGKKQLVLRYRQESKINEK